MSAKKPKRIRAVKLWGDRADIIYAKSLGRVCLGPMAWEPDDEELYFIRRADVEALVEQIWRDYTGIDLPYPQSVATLSVAFRKAGMTAPKGKAK